MKKLIISCVVILLASISSYGQFSDKGYKDLKLRMPLADAKKIVNFKIVDEAAEVRYDGLVLELTYYEYYGLYGIRTYSPNAKLEGVKQNLIGKNLKEIKAILGSKLEKDYGANEYIYYTNSAAKNNELTSCVLHFDDNGILEHIAAVFNP